MKKKEHKSYVIQWYFFIFQIIILKFANTGGSGIFSALKGTTKKNLELMGFMLSSWYN